MTKNLFRLIKKSIQNITLRIKSIVSDNILMFSLLAVIFVISSLVQYSALGYYNQFIQTHIIRLIFALFLILTISFIDKKIWIHYAYLFYTITLILLMLVNILGTTKLGAQRWFDLYFFIFQPSELMKLSLLITLSKYYSSLNYYEIQSLRVHIIPILLILIPTILIMKQPDLGTAIILFLLGISIIFISGFPLKKFLSLSLAGLLTCPLAWFFLHDYQKERILTFLDPQRDPFGAGYHILQSKIAIGSGGIFGKGFLSGTQIRLNFLPEKNTDFIFTALCEEHGLIGALVIIFLLLSLVLICILYSISARNNFFKIFYVGSAALLFFNVFINIAMVMGLLPIVGVPLPFISYGGSSLFTFAALLAIIISSKNSQNR